VSIYTIMFIEWRLGHKRFRPTDYIHTVYNVELSRPAWRAVASKSQAAFGMFVFYCTKADVFLMFIMHTFVCSKDKLKSVSFWSTCINAAKKHKKDGYRQLNVRQLGS